MSKLLLILIGIAAGFLCGLLGVGGGVILVLLLTRFFHIDQHTAQATAITVIFAAALSSALSYLLARSLDFTLILPTLCGSLLGGWLGASLMHRLSAYHLQLLFALFMLIAGVKMLW